MTIENDFLPFASSADATVESQDSWAVDAAVLNGFTAGVLMPGSLNKALRQPSLMTAALAALLVQVLGQNVLDNGSVPTLLAQVWQLLLTGTSFQDTGAANALLVVPPAGVIFPLPQVGTAVHVRIAVSNTGTTTLNWMDTGIAPVTTPSGAALSAGMLVAGAYASLVFDGAHWQLVGGGH